MITRCLATPAHSGFPTPDRPTAARQAVRDLRTRPAAGRSAGGYRPPHCAPQSTPARRAPRGDVGRGTCCWRPSITPVGNEDLGVLRPPVEPMPARPGDHPGPGALPGGLALGASSTATGAFCSPRSSQARRCSSSANHVTRWSWTAGAMDSRTSILEAVDARLPGCPGLRGNEGAQVLGSVRPEEPFRPQPDRKALVGQGGVEAAVEEGQRSEALCQRAALLGPRSGGGSATPGPAPPGLRPRRLGPTTPTSGSSTGQLTRYPSDPSTTVPDAPVAPMTPSFHETVPSR